MKKQSIDVAAYIWPAYTGKEERTRIFWPDGEGEWQTVRKADAKFPCHPWPRKPLLGYQDEADPAVMARQIDLALSHGVNVFIYDWYWFDGRPFLENCLNEGFLKAENNGQMKFYLMWANHDANHLWDRRLSDTVGSTVIWRGKIDPSDFYVIGRRWLDQYFTLPNYYTVDGKPVIAIYDLHNFVSSFGSVEKTAEMMQWLDEEAKKYGLPGVHFQLIYWNQNATNLSGVDGGSKDESQALSLPFQSITHYQFVHFADVDTTYPEIIPAVLREWDRLEKDVPLPYYPHVSLGWDNNPRFLTLKPNILRENTPENIEIMLRAAKAHALSHQMPLVTINSWNEWTEGSYLLPDDRFGCGYLEAVRKVFLEEK